MKVGASDGGAPTSPWNRTSPSASAASVEIPIPQSRAPRRPRAVRAAVTMKPLNASSGGAVVTSPRRISPRGSFMINRPIPTERPAFSDSGIASMRCRLTRVSVSARNTTPARKTAPSACLQPTPSSTSVRKKKFWPIPGARAIG